ncbi:MAG: ABC transporter substrate-binding protein, partial [Longimicrobiales bacterium]
MVAASRSPVIALLALAFAACADRPATGGDDVADGTRQGATLVIAAPTDLDAMNSLVSNEAYTEEILLHALYLPLVRFDSALNYVPALAREWEIVGDTAVVFHLRDDVRWHDGAPTTAYDVAFTFERAKDPETAFPNGDYFLDWNSVEVVDSFTVRFAIDPHIDPLTGWAFTAIMPRHLLDSIPAAGMANASFNRNPVGNGPFRFVSYQANDRWVFEANPDFPEALGGRPNLDRIVWRVIPENSAQVVELETGNADLILSPRAEQLTALDARPEFRKIVKPSRNYVFIGWNGRRGVLGDARVRHALTMAIDRGEILATLRAGYGELSTGPVGPYHWAYDPALEPIPFDTAAARALLAEAGVRDANGDGTLDTPAGAPFTIELKIPANNAFNRDVAEMVQSDLAAVGVRLTPRPVDFSTLIGDIS